MTTESLMDEFYKRQPPGLILSKRILFALLKDILGRRGFGHVMCKIDPEIQEEILSAWLRIIETNLRDR